MVDEIKSNSTAATKHLVVFTMMVASLAGKELGLVLCPNVGAIAYIEEWVRLTVLGAAMSVPSSMRTDSERNDEVRCLRC